MALKLSARGKIIFFTVTLAVLFFGLSIDKEIHPDGGVYQQLRTYSLPLGYSRNPYGRENLIGRHLPVPVIGEFVKIGDHKYTLITATVLIGTTLIIGIYKLLAFMLREAFILLACAAAGYFTVSGLQSLGYKSATMPTAIQKVLPREKAVAKKDSSKRKSTKGSPGSLIFFLPYIAVCVYRIGKRRE